MALPDLSSEFARDDAIMAKKALLRVCISRGKPGKDLELGVASFSTSSWSSFAPYYCGPDSQLDLSAPRTPKGPTWLVSNSPYRPIGRAGHGQGESLRI